MRRICGFILFWISVGMAIGFWLGISFWSIVLLIGLLIFGFNLFCG
ncbi:MAG: hypothetical protein HDT39_13500 [Lachnospiraceae bacterium]|nr:hypothetical protein [Lachnospiraceae bacterium]MDE6253910.1 hypothetical protein [Lachnospiraceae bacterium]